MNIASLSTYGADPAGLICGYLIEPDAASHAIESADAAVWLDEKALGRGGALDPTDASFLWLHFNLSHTGAMPWLRKHAGLREDFFDMLGDALHSTRVERVEQALIAVINDVNFDFSFDPSDTSTLWINVEQHLVVTARRQPLRSAVELLEHLLRAQADVLVEIVRGERIKLLQDEIAAQVVEATNRSLFVLTIVTVLALPINIIAGLLGMNVGGVPLAQHAHGFWIVVAIVVSFTLIAGWVAFRKQRSG